MHIMYVAFLTMSLCFTVTIDIVSGKYTIVFEKYHINERIVAVAQDIIKKYFPADPAVCWKPEEVVVKEFFVHNCITSDEITRVRKMLNDSSTKIVFYNGENTLLSIIEGGSFKETLGAKGVMVIARMTPSYTSQGGAVSIVADHLIRYGKSNLTWSANIVFDDTYEIDMHLPILSTLSKGAKVIMHTGRDSLVIDAIRKSGVFFTIMLLDHHKTISILTEAVSLGLSDPKYVWLLYNMHPNMTDIHPLRLGSAVNMDLGSLLNSSVVLYNSYHRLVYDMITAVKALLQQDVCHENTVIEVSGLAGRFEVNNKTVVSVSWDYYVYHKVLLKDPVETWVYSTLPGFQPPPFTIPTVLESLTIRAVVMMEAPFAMYKEDHNSSLPLLDQLEGFNIDIIRSLDETNEFKFSFSLAPSEDYGIELPNGTWSGAIGAVLTGKYDFAVGPFSISNSRSQVVDFSRSIMMNNMIMVFAEKVDTSPLMTMFQFLQPLDSLVWTVILCSPLAAALVLTVLHKITPNEYNFQYYNSLFFTFGALFHGVSSHQPDRNSSRFMAGCWYFFALMGVIGFCCNYAAFRVYNRMRVEIETPRDILLQEHYTHGVLRNSFTDNYFSNSSFPNIVMLNEKMRSDPNALVNSSTAGLKRTVDGSYVFFTDDLSHELLSEVSCKLKKSAPYESTQFAFAMAKGAKYRAAINDKLTDMERNGVLTALHKRYFKPKPKAEACVDSGFFHFIEHIVGHDSNYYAKYAISLKDTLGMYFILVSGMFLSLIIACVEYVVRRCLEMKKTKKEEKKRQKERRFQGINESSA